MWSARLGVYFHIRTTSHATARCCMSYLVAAAAAAVAHSTRPTTTKQILLLFDRRTAQAQHKTVTGMQYGPESQSRAECADYPYVLQDLFALLFYYVIILLLFFSLLLFDYCCSHVLLWRASMLGERNDSREDL